jgi:hypothetical protein
MLDHVCKNIKMNNSNIKDKSSNLSPRQRFKQDTLIELSLRVAVSLAIYMYTGSLEVFLLILLSLLLFFIRPLYISYLCMKRREREANENNGSNINIQ